MRLGILARQDRGGLGYQSLEVWRHLNPAVTIVVDIGQRRGPPGAIGWYGDAPVIRWDRNHELPGAADLLADCDVVWSAETFYDLTLTKELHRRGVATVLHVNVELHDGQYASTYWAPSEWLIDRLPDGTRVVEMPTPFDRYPEMQPLDEPLRIVHPAGLSALADRNGTSIMLHCRKALMAQGFEVDLVGPSTHLRGVRIRFVDEYWERDPGAAVSVMPRRYGGLCLPALEAQCAGVPVIMPDVIPNGMFTDLRTPPHKHAPVQTKAGQVPAVHTDPGELQKMIGGLLSNRERLEGERIRARGWAMSKSWDAQAWRWWEALEAARL